MPLPHSMRSRGGACRTHGLEVALQSDVRLPDSDSHTADEGVVVQHLGSDVLGHLLYQLRGAELALRDSLYLPAKQVSSVVTTTGR